MLSVLILGFLAGALFINGLPHLGSGVSGKSHASPLGDSAAVNVTWGWINWLVAVILWHIAPMAEHPRAAFVAVAAAILLVGWALAAGAVKSPRLGRARAKKNLLNFAPGQGINAQGYHG